MSELDHAPFRGQPPAHADPAADYDLLWRKQPKRLGFIQYARAIPGLAGLFARQVPGEAWLQIETGVAQVSCPCGATPCCEDNVPTPCVCERVFVYFAGDVRVAYVTEPRS